MLNVIHFEDSRHYYQIVSDTLIIWPGGDTSVPGVEIEIEDVEAMFECWRVVQKKGGKQ